MSERSTGERSGRELPPGWTAIDASTVAGSLYVAVWRAFPDATPFEYGWAMAPLPGRDISWLRAADGVARVGALREARGGRSDLPEDIWQWCVNDQYPTLSEQGRQNAKAILAAIAMLRPQARSASPGAPRRREADTRREIVEALANLAQRGDADPTRDAIAYTMGHDVRTLRRWVKAFPRLANVLPGRRRRGS
jgi:hypothetical protein